MGGSSGTPLTLPVTAVLLLCRRCAGVRDTDAMTSPGRGPLGPPPAATDAVLGVPVERGTVPAAWDAPVQWRGALWADERRALLRIGPAGLWVEDGRRIVLEVGDDDRSTYDHVVYGSARLLLTQRRRFSLHATLVATPDGHLVAVAGDSMAGKSTTVAALVAAGWTFGCDDLAEIDPSGTVAVPHERPVHLSDPAARLLGGDPATGRPLPGRTKRAYHLPADLTPRPLAAVVHLTADPDLAGERPLAVRLDPVQALVQLAAIGERTGLVELPALRAAYVAWVGALVRSVPVLAVRRPGEGDTVAAVVDLVRSAVAGTRPGR